MESSTGHLLLLSLVTTAAKNARSEGACVISVLLVIYPPLFPKYFMSSYFVVLRLLLVLCHPDSRDKPFTSAAFGIVNDNRT